METKIIKVTDKGQISLPVRIRENLEIDTGDSLIVVQSGDSLVIKKVKKDEFSDLLKLSEISLKKLWDNPEDEIWDKYIENES